MSFLKKRWYIPVAAVVFFNFIAGTARAGHEEHQRALDGIESRITRRTIDKETAETKLEQSFEHLKAANKRLEKLDSERDQELS